MESKPELRLKSHALVQELTPTYSESELTSRSPSIAVREMCQMISKILHSIFTLFLCIIFVSLFAVLCVGWELLVLQFFGKLSISPLFISFIPHLNQPLSSDSASPRYFWVFVWPLGSFQAFSPSVTIWVLHFLHLHKMISRIVMRALIQRSPFFYSLFLDFIITIIPFQYFQCYFWTEKR